MIRVDIAEAEPRLSALVDAARQGEIVVLCRRNVPVAELRPLPAPPRQPRPVGIDRGMEVPDSFFEPLPEELLEAFGGKPAR